MDSAFTDYAEDLAEMEVDDMSEDDRRAFSWNQAIAMGFKPDDYSFGPLTSDTWTATLDIKIWGKNRCLGCYFTADDGKKFRLTAFPCRTGIPRRYTARDELFDLSDESVKAGQRFALTIGINGKGNQAWMSAKPIE